MNEFCALTVTCTTNEWNKDRVKAVSDYFESHGAIVEHAHLKHCDYHIEGIYKETEVNIGVENKTLHGDFFKSIEDMPKKLFEAYQVYNDVCLVIEEGNYTIKMTDDNLDCWIQEPKMQAITGANGIGTLNMYNNFCGSMASSGVYVRSYRTIAHLGVTLSGLIKSIVKPIHRGLEIEKPSNDKLRMANFLIRIDGIGAQGAMRGADYIPNLERLLTLSLDDMQDIWGNVKGKKAYQCIHHESRKEECAKNWDILYQKNLPKRQKEIETQIKKNKSHVKTSNTKENLSNVKFEPLDSKDNIDVSSQSTTGTQSPGESHADDAHSNIQVAALSIHDTPKIKESDLLPRVKDVIEYIRQKPRKIEEVQNFFDFTSDYTFQKLMEFKLAGKIWFESSTRTWQFGKDMNPIPVVATKEFDLGV